MACFVYMEAQRGLLGHFRPLRLIWAFMGLLASEAFQGLAGPGKACWPLRPFRVLQAQERPLGL